MVSVTFFYMVSVTFFMVSVGGLLVDSAAAGGSIILEHIERFLVFCVFRIGFRRWFFMVSVTFFHGFRRWIFGGFCRGRRIDNFRTYRAIPSLLCFEGWIPSLVFLWFPLRFFIWSPLPFLWFPSVDFWWILPPQEDP